MSRNINPGLHPGLRSGTRFGVLEQWGNTIMECQLRRHPYSLMLVIAIIGQVWIKRRDFGANSALTKTINFVESSQLNGLVVTRRLVGSLGHWKTMIRAVISLIVLLPMCGCIGSARSPSTKPIHAGWHLLGDPSLAPEETRAVSVAHNYLVLNPGKWIEAYYHPRKAKDDDGYYVDLMFLVRDEAGGKPRFVDPCSSVRISADWRTVDYVRW